ncbi:Ig-like domain repeat protein [Micropruina sp.]|uniref:Ig-like domain repeat protein n=1 Tax=Micropruina sp. TaxID=2737536 RepID=UPI0039E45EB8
MSITTSPPGSGQRHRRGLRAIATVAVVALLGGGFSTLAATDAAAAPVAERGEGTLTVTTAAVEPGGTITVVGTGFDQRPAEGGTLAFKLNDGAIEIPDGQSAGTVTSGTLYVSEADLLPDAEGNFEFELTIPDLEPSESTETYWVRALAGLDGGTAASKFAYFTVAQSDTEEPSTAKASVTKVTTASSGSVSLTIAGSGHTAGSTVALSYAGNSVNWSGNAATLTVADDGSFGGTATLAAGTALAGTHTITVDGSEDPAIEAEFTTVAAISISGNPSPGASVTATAVNLPAGASVTKLGAGSNWLTASVEASASGAATLSGVTVPSDATVGTAIVLTYAVGDATVDVSTGKVVTPDDTALNTDRFTVTSAALHNGLYQTAENPTTGKLFATAAVGRPPVTDSRLLKLDSTTLAVEIEATPAVADEATGGLFAVYGVGLDNKLGQVWVTNTRQNTVAVYSQDDLSLLKQFPAGTTDHSRDVIVDETTHKAYVSSSSKTYVDVFDAQTLTYLERISLGTDDEPFQTVMSLDLDQATGKLYTVSLGSPQAAVIDTRNGNAVRYYDLGDNVSSASGVAFDADRNRLYVASQSTNNLVVLDLGTGTVIADIPTGAGALNASYDPVNDLVFVANRTGGTFTVINPATLKKTANLPGGTNPNHVETGANGVTFGVNKAPLVDGAATNAVFRITANAEPISIARPAVTGKLAVGGTLKATTGGWLNATGGTVSYEWLRNGAEIEGADESSYKVTTADAGYALQVRVTVKAGGYTATVTSPEVKIAKISSKTKVSFNATTKKKGKAGTATVTVTASGISKPTGIVKVYDGSKVIGTATITAANKGVATVTLKALKKGTHTLKASFLGSTQLAASTSSKTKLKVK